MFTVYITSLIQRSHSATIVSIIMLVYLLYFCVSVYMYMFFCTRHHSLLIVSCVRIMGQRSLILPNKSIKSNQIKSINSKTTDTYVIIELSFNIPVKPGKKSSQEKQK